MRRLVTTELLVGVSDVVGIVAGVCTVLSYLESYAQREDRRGRGHRGCSLSSRKWVLSKGLDEVTDLHVAGEGEKAACF